MGDFSSTYETIVPALTDVPTTNALWVTRFYASNAIFAAATVRDVSLNSSGPYWGVSMSYTIDPSLKFDMTTGGYTVYYAYTPLG
jgi:hypothetical protein